MGKLRGKNVEEEENEEIVWQIGLILDREGQQEVVGLEGHEEVEEAEVVEEDVWW